MNKNLPEIAIPRPLRPHGPVTEVEDTPTVVVRFPLRAVPDVRPAAIE